MNDITRTVWAKAVEYMLKLVPSAREETVWMEVFATAVSYFNRFIVRYQKRFGRVLVERWLGILGVVCMGLAVKMKGCPFIDQGLLLSFAHYISFTHANS